MTKNKIFKIYGIGIFGVFIGFGLFNITSHSYANKKIPKRQEIDLQYAASFSDDRILMGASHDVFVGKVIQQVGTKERGIGPETQFEVEIIDNIKGNLNGIITVDQQGGYKNGVLYIVSDGVVSPDKNENNYLLQVGSTYLFATRYNKEENWYTLNSYPTASKLLSNNSALSNDQLDTLAKSDQRVEQLRGAYSNEILLETDIEHNNTLNSYQSITGTPPPADVDNLTPTSTTENIPQASATSSAL